MTLYGIDASHHQGTIDFGAVKRAGNSFVFLKATEGTGYTDPNYYANDAKARAAGLVVGAYHFASATDPVAEADYFCRVVGALQVGDLVVLDWETKAPNPPAWCRTWLDRVTLKLGVRPLIYMNQTARDGSDWTQVATGNYGLWLAQYDGTTTVPNPGRWPNVALKQFTSSGSVPGVSGSCDRNVFFGDATTLAAYGFQEIDMTPEQADQLAWIYTSMTPGRTHIKLDGSGFAELKAGAWSVTGAVPGVHASGDLYNKVSAIAAALGGQPSSVDPKALAAAIVAALPADLATQVVDEMAKRLNTSGS